MHFLIVTALALVVSLLLRELFVGLPLALRERAGEPQVGDQKQQEQRDFEASKARAEQERAEQRRHFLRN